MQKDMTSILQNTKDMMQNHTVLKLFPNFGGNKLRAKQ